MTIIMSMTWKEMLRKRVLLLTLILTFLFLAAFWFIAKTLGDVGGSSGGFVDLIEQFARGSFILSLGFFFGSFVVAFLAIFSSFSAIAGEAEQGVLQALMPRPIPRWKWYAGRWLGYVSLCVLFSAVLFGSILFITEIHSVVPKDMWVLGRSFLLFISVVPLLVSLSMLGSSLFSAVGNGVFLTMLYGGGWLGGMIEKLSGSLGLEEAVLKPLKTIAGLLSLIMPTDAIQRKMLSVLLSFDQLSGVADSASGILGLFGSGDRFGNSQIPSTSFMVYAALYTAAAFLLGMWRFNKKDL